MEKSAKNIIETTSDGSKTIYVPELDEHYHSVNGALNEAITVFIKPGLPTISKKEVSILEIGFGTGLNAMLTAIEAMAMDKRVYYYGIEKYPVDPHIINELEYGKLVDPVHSCLFQDIHSCRWDELCEINPNFALYKICTDIKVFKSNKKFDIIYFDAFAKSKQPGMWTDEIIKGVCSMAGKGSLFLTYSATGQLKRQLISNGFQVKRLPGPTGKREITRAEMV